MSEENRIDMSSEAVTARLKLACQLGNFARALIAARSAAARAKLEELATRAKSTSGEGLITHPPADAGDADQS